MLSPKARSSARLWPTCTLLFLAGCLPEAGGDKPSDSAESLPEQILSAGPPRMDVGESFSEVEPNDDYLSAARLGVGSAVELLGAIASGSGVRDRDLYDVGPAEPGDRLQAQLTVSGGSEVVLGIVDEQQRLLGFIDPRSSTSGPSAIDLVVRESTSLLYAVVATRYGLLQDASYDVHLTWERGAGLPAYRPQIVVLDFEGADQVRIGNRPPLDIPAFDAANISDRFADQTATIIEYVLDAVREDYAGLGIVFYLSTDPQLPAGELSRVYFGTYDQRLLGLADNIDPYNAHLTQTGVVYTDTFSVFKTLSPTVEQIAQVLANVTSHEVGHLLGLRHTAEPTCIMDVTATARQMLLDQEFHTADLDESVLPIGVQDAPAMLSWTLGGGLGPSPMPKFLRRQRAIEAAGKEGDFYVPRWQLGTCAGPP